MSKIKVKLDGNILTIHQQRTRENMFDQVEVDISKLMYDKGYSSDMKVASMKNQNRLFFMEPYNANHLLEDVDGQKDNVLEEGQIQESLDVIAVWSNEKNVRYGVRNISSLYNEFFKFRYKLLHIGLNRRYLSVWMIGHITQLNKDVHVDNVKFYIDEYNNLPSKIQVSSNPFSRKQIISLKNIHHYKIYLKDLFTDRTQINNMLNLVVTVNGQPTEYRLGKKERYISNIKKYYAPYKSCYTQGHAVHLRRTDRGNFAIVKRPMEEIEGNSRFRIMESRLVSGILYHIGKIASKRGRKVNLFYEKFSEKAEEGTFDLFKMGRESGDTDCYYIIDEHTPDYERIKNEKNVVKKYSMQYYWLIYRVNCFISTEAPAHLNLLRSNNRHFRISTVEHPFVFLQHGVTYLKCQGPSSTFVTGKEGEPTYMIVGSEKERDVLTDMLKIPEEKFLNTGLPIFSLIDYKHMDQNSPDKAVIMLTWKSYEEHIQNFENSEYYKSVMEIYHMLENYLPSEDIYIVAHPKMKALFAGTKMEKSIWDKPISKILEIAKLLVTDYSSACYNSFYQGGAVVFYQPDLERYEREAGNLIPKDDEYIGYRTYQMKELENVMSEIITDGKIQLDKARTEEFEKRYLTINQYTDGKNLERIFQKLKDLKIL